MFPIFPDILTSSLSLGVLHNRDKETAVTEHSALKYWANLLQYIGTAKYKIEEKKQTLKANWTTFPQSYHSSINLKRAYVQSAPAAIDVIFEIIADLTVEHCQTLHVVTSAFLYLIMLEKRKFVSHHPC